MSGSRRCIGRLALPLWMLVSALLPLPADVGMAADDHTWSLQLQGFAPNAGGQRVYALRRSTDDTEWAVIASE